MIVPFSTSILNICSWQPATSISRVPFDVKFMHFRSLNSGLLQGVYQYRRCHAGRRSVGIHEVPLCQPATRGIMHTRLRYGQYTLLGEEELLHGPFSSSMSTVGRISVKRRSMEGGDSTLRGCQSRSRAYRCRRTYSHTHCPSTAVLARYQRRKWLPASQDDVGPGAAAERTQASRVSMIWTSGQSCRGCWSYPSKT